MVSCHLQEVLWGLQAVGNKFFLISKKQPHKAGTGENEAGYERLYCIYRQFLQETLFFFNNKIFSEGW